MLTNPAEPALHAAHPDTAPTPLIGIACGMRTVGEHAAHAVVARYVDAVAEGAHGLPLLVPALGPRVDPADWVAQLDGLLLTGSPSNVQPHHYGGEPSRPGTLHDADRDATTLPLVRAAVAADMPVLGICLGIEELNVALGGSLHQRVHELPGFLDHRAPEGPLERRYAYAAHHVSVRPDGLLARLHPARELLVNSLHSQGIDRLAPALTAEAHAPDGLIEAVSLPGARFVVGIQWHPEYRFADYAPSRALFAAFGAATRARAAGRRGAAAYSAS